jgi:predicted nucleic acid-binding protein
MASGEVVIDANVAVKWYLRNENYRAKAKDILADARKNRVALLAPPFFPYEFETAIQRRLLGRTITLKEADSYLKVFYQVPISLIDDPQLITKAREIARQTYQVTIYDSLYAALAELQGCDFWTADRKFYEAATKQFASVRFLADYN